MLIHTSSLVTLLIFIYCDLTVEALDNGALRLVGGSNYRTGRVEVYIKPNNTWGTVCDNGWDENDALVVCRQLGFGDVATPLQAFSPSASTNIQIWLDNVGCSGQEDKLIDCRHNGVGIHNCNHSNNAGVVCEGNFPKLPLRLIGGRNVGEGRVEVYYNNSWTRVCSDGWNDNGASAVCRQLGVSGSGTKFGIERATGTLLMDEVRCNQGQSNIFHCPHSGFGNSVCSSGQVARVSCNGLYGSNVRLSPRQSRQGRVELLYRNRWGTVCDDGWDDTDAGVVCRQLGFGSSGTAIGSAGFGQGSGPIWLDNVLCTGSEPTVAGCGHFGVNITRNCSHSEDAGVRCNGTQVVPMRLVNGNSKGGRVEFRFNGYWGTICNRGWNAKASTVICRQLGLGDTGTISNGHGGAGPGSPVYLDRVVCDGSEPNVLACSHDRIGWHNCDHSRDVGVACSGLYNASIRLADGSNVQEGRVEIMYQGMWGTICDAGWDDIDATVVCRELGYSHGNATKQAQFGSGTGPVWLHRVDCLGNESKLSHCIHPGAGNTMGCSHSRDAGVQCVGYVNIRLVGGSSYNEGRVEVNYNGEWGTVCDDGWDDTDAGVVCRQLGFGSSGTAIGSAGFGQGSGSIWLDSVTCTGSELMLLNCSHLGVGMIENCSHLNDAGVRCNGTQVIAVRLSDGHNSSSGRVEMYINGQWGTVCDDGWTTGSSTVVCRQLGLGATGTFSRYGTGSSVYPIYLDEVTCDGSEANILACPHLRLGDHDCNHGDDVGVTCSGLHDAEIRIVGGANEQEGIIEIMYQGVWGTICADGWDDIDATVVCRELGYSHGSITRQAQFGSGSGPVWLHQVGCLGNESKLSHCIHPGAGNVGNCSHTQDAGVQCSTITEVAVRLVGGGLYNEGRVEVNYNGEWGTVCGDGWDDTDAGVVCRQLGFGSSGTAIGSAGFGQGSGPILLDGVVCAGDELVLANCDNLGVNVRRSCDHSKDAGVKCFIEQGVVVRLVGGSSYNEGRVEVNYNGEWGTVCDDGWDDTDAGVVCRQLGFGSSGTAIGSAGFGQGSGSIWLNSVTCTGSESTLASCGHPGVGIIRSCDHSRDAGVTCSSSEVIGAMVRLVGGSSYNEGRVEVNYNGEWGTVCDDGWDDTDAGVVCRQLGFGSSGTAIGSAGFGQGSGSVWLDSVTCTGSESTLASCGHLGVGVTRNCDHLNDASVMCTGKFRFPVRVQRNSLLVEVYINGQWGLVCANGWDTHDADVACREAFTEIYGTAVPLAYNEVDTLWLSGVDCVGNESRLSLCPHNGIGVVDNCTYVAGVKCSVAGASDDDSVTSSSSSSFNVMIVGGIIVVIIICLLLLILTVVILVWRRKKKSHDINSNKKDKNTNTTNPLYSRGRYNEIIFSDDNTTKGQYMAVNARYGELRRTSHVYETIPEKQETDPKKKDPNVHDYCYIDDATMKAHGMSFDKQSDTIKSVNAPVSYNLDDHGSSIEVINPQYSSHNKPVSSTSKPTDVPVEVHSDLSADEHVPQVQQYALLDTTSHDPVGEHQKSVIKPPDPSMHVTPTEVL